MICPHDQHLTFLVSRTARLPYACLFPCLLYFALPSVDRCTAARMNGRLRFLRVRMPYSSGAASSKKRREEETRREWRFLNFSWKNHHAAGKQDSPAALTCASPLRAKCYLPVVALHFEEGSGTPQAAVSYTYFAHIQKQLELEPPQFLIAYLRIGLPRSERLLWVNAVLVLPLSVSSSCKK